MVPTTKALGPHVISPDHGCSTQLQVPAAYHDECRQLRAEERPLWGELRESQVDWAGAGGPWRLGPLLDLHLRWWGPLRGFYRVITGSDFHFQWVTLTYYTTVFP